MCNALAYSQNPSSRNKTTAGPRSYDFHFGRSRKLGPNPIVPNRSPT